MALQLLLDQRLPGGRSVAWLSVLIRCRGWPGLHPSRVTRGLACDARAGVVPEFVPHDGRGGGLLRARSQTSTAIRNLLGLAPKVARRIEPGGTESDVRLETVLVTNFASVTGKGVTGTVEVHRSL